jgi:membrane-bound lytic murein transglycosylase B
MLLAAGMLAALPGCAAERPPTRDAPQVAPRPEPRPAPVARPAGFAEWLASFHAKALAAGIRADLLDATLGNLTVNEGVLDRDAYQPEFRRQLWDYLDRAVSGARIRIGRDKRAEHGALLAAIAARYGVDGDIVLAIWGLESAYGANMGGFNVIEALATLAWEGRRRDFAERELLTALGILAEGDVTADRMVGSWAGAMGHTQFIPSSYVALAEDWTGDGRRDIWADDPADALASTANYLRHHGWQAGLPWGLEVRVPEGFDVGLADGETWRPTADWAATGLRDTAGRPLPALGEIAVVAPAGLRGPVFAITRNFMAIRRYNNAFSYALAVGHLADRVAGRPPFVATWPRSEAVLSAEETREVQERLTALGYDTKGADGLVGPRTVIAIRDFQRARGLVLDGFPTRVLLEALRKGG